MQRLFRYGFIAVLVTAAVWYALWQARFLIAGPDIAVSKIPSTVQNERVIVLEGQAKNITALYLNGRPIAVDQAGVFAEDVVLENGYTIVSIDAEDRYGRNTHWEMPFVYAEKIEQAVETPDKNNL